MILSIDIGINGSIVVYDERLDIFERFYSIPTKKRKVGRYRNKKGEMADKLRTEYDLAEMQNIPYLMYKGMANLCVIEDVHPMPMDGKLPLSLLMFGKGLYYGLLTGSHIPIVPISPQSWKKYFGLIGKDKKASIDKFKEFIVQGKIKMNPEYVDLKLWDGLTDAVLMAYYQGHKETI